MSINYNNKIFKAVANSSNGEVGNDTVLHYYQKDDIVWAIIEGGFIRFGTVLGKVDENGRINMCYQHINANGELKTGKCNSIPELLPDGRIRLYEHWQWTSPDTSNGKAIIEEVI
jgi:hypothetical protein